MYTFVRNEDFYREITQYLSKRININELNKIILSRNISLLSKLLENCTQLDKKEFYIDNKDKIINSLQEAHWTKGEKFFNLFIQSWNTE